MTEMTDRRAAHLQHLTINRQQRLASETTDEGFDFSVTEIVTEINQQLIPPLQVQVNLQYMHTQNAKCLLPCFMLTEDVLLVVTKGSLVVLEVFTAQYTCSSIT